jgi:hypothetical protein
VTWSKQRCSEECGEVPACSCSVQTS